jgi:hypothetical protein
MLAAEVISRFAAEGLLRQDFPFQQLNPMIRNHSCRNAATGSTRKARSAGT